MNIDAVAFDLDGTLYPRATMYLLSVPLAARYPRFLYHFGRVRRVLRRLQRIEDFRRTQAHLVAARLRLEPSLAEQMVDRIIYREWVALLRKIRPFPHVGAAIAGLRRAGLRLGLMSDYPVQQKLRFLGLDGLWDASLCSEESGYLKPHAAPFLRLARDLGIAPRRILYVGDNPGYDARGAAAAGMRTALIGRRGAPADLFFSSYRGFAEAVARRF